MPGTERGTLRLPSARKPLPGGKPFVRRGQDFAWSLPTPRCPSYLNGACYVQGFLHAGDVQLNNPQVFAFDNDGAQIAEKPAAIEGRVFRQCRQDAPTAYKIGPQKIRDVRHMEHKGERKSIVV